MQLSVRTLQAALRAEQAKLGRIQRHKSVLARKNAKASRGRIEALEYAIAALAQD